MKNSKNESDKLRMHLPPVKLILDPHRMEDAYSMAVVTQLYRGLLRFNPKGDVVLDLAESWKQSLDHLHYTFKLKQATFSDGTPITAEHVRNSIARIFALGAAMGADLDYIAGVSQFKKSGNLTDLGIKILSPRDVEFTLDHPSSLFLMHLAVVDCSILPIHEPRQELSRDAKGPFSGPYRISGTPDDKHLEIEKWRSDALDSKNPPARVEYLMTGEDPIALAREGKTDTLDRDPITPEIRQELINKGWTGSPTGLTGEEFIILNPKYVSLTLRQYLWSKVDPDELTKTLGISAYSPAYGLIPAGILGELPKEKLTRWKEKSPKNLKGQGAGSFVFEYDEKNATDLRVVEYLKRVWTSPGLSIEWRPLPRREKLKHMFAKESQACLARKGLDYPDGISVVNYFKSGIEANYFHVEDPEVDQELQHVGRIFNDAARIEKYHEIQLKVLGHFTVIPLFFGTEASGLWSSKVSTIPAHPMGYHTLPMETVGLR